MLIKKFLLSIVAAIALSGSAIASAANVTKNLTTKITGAPLPTTAVVNNAQQTTPAAAVKLELEMSKDAHYNIFTLPNPSRLIVDIKSGAINTKFDKNSFASTPITGVRTGKRDNGTLRIVFDLNEPVSFASQEAAGSVDNSAKLVIYLTKKKAAIATNTVRVHAHKA